MSQKKLEIVTFENTKYHGLVPQVNMPAVITCNKKAPCLHCHSGAYCHRHNFARQEVKDKHKRILQAYRNNPDAFFDEINAMLNLGVVEYKLFRWFTVGDLPDYEFLERIVKLARKNRNTVFSLYTKHYYWVNDYLDKHRFPKNLTVLLSAWGDFVPENPHNLPMCYIKFKRKDEVWMNEFIPEKPKGRIIICDRECFECYECFGKSRKGDVVIMEKR